jgi:hypothetical protein
MLIFWLYRFWLSSKYGASVVWLPAYRCPELAMQLWVAYMWLGERISENYLRRLPHSRHVLLAALAHTSCTTASSVTGSSWTRSRFRSICSFTAVHRVCSDLSEAKLHRFFRRTELCGRTDGALSYSRPHIQISTDPETLYIERLLPQVTPQSLPFSHFEFIIHWSSYHTMIYNLRYWRRH